MENTEEFRKRKVNKTWILVGALIVIVVGLLVWNLSQQQIISDSNEKIVVLEKNQLPSTLFKSYDDCNSNGGAILNTINAGFNGCLGGNEDETDELPQYQAFLQYSAQDLPRILERNDSSVGSKVTANDDVSTELVAFLEKDGGCEPDRGEYEVVKEVADRFSLMKYGCDGDGQVQSDNPPTIIGIKLADGWVLLSPTNNMDEEGRPSCLLVDMFKISKELSTKCFENTGYNNGSLKDVVYP